MTKSLIKFETRDYLVQVESVPSSSELQPWRMAYVIKHKTDEVNAMTLTQLAAAIVAAQALQEELDRVMSEARNALPEEARVN